MRLPQDRILHIGTELAGEEVRVVAEWQGELVRCEDCIHRQTYECPMYHEEWHTVDEGDGYWDDDLVIFDWTVDDGYCYLGDNEGDGDE